MSGYRDMLKLNPGDNQGVRYALLVCLLRQDDPVQINNLLDAYPDEWSAFWLYTRLLVAFRAGEQGKKKTAALIKDAMSTNEHVPAILVGRKRPTRSNRVISPSGAPTRRPIMLRSAGHSGSAHQALWNGSQAPRSRRPRSVKP
jgi:hypothetical protein